MKKSSLLLILRFMACYAWRVAAGLALARRGPAVNREAVA
jgi:hypothetical protein